MASLKDIALTIFQGLEAVRREIESGLAEVRFPTAPQSDDHEPHL